MGKNKALQLADYLKDRNRLDLTCNEAAEELIRLSNADKALSMALEFLEKIEHPDCTDEIMAIKEALQEKTAPKG